MSIKTRVRRMAFGQHILIEKLTSNGVDKFLQRFRSKYVSCDLIRVGGEGDGGYLLPDNLSEVSYCFSPGVDYTAKFEHELSTTHGIRSFMADASVDSAPIADRNFEFIPKFLGSRTHGSVITLSDWIRDSIGDDGGKRILQMDIEGGEYDVLTYESSETLAQFSSMIVEFHGLDKLFQRDFLRMFSAVFEKIYHDFSICHVHPNNCSRMAVLDGIEVPPTIEVTFIRNDLVSTFGNGRDIHLPHPLDRKNVETNLDIAMPSIWWKGN